MKVEINSPGTAATPMPGTDGSDSKPPVAGSPAVTAEAAEQPSAAGSEANLSQGNAAAEPASRSQLLIENSIKALLAQLAKSLSGRHQLLESLPPEVRGQAEHILQQTMPKGQALAGGLFSLLKAQANTAEQLKALAGTLNDYHAGSTDVVNKLPDSVIRLFKQALQPKAVDAGTAPMDGPALLKLAGRLADEGSKSQAAAAIQQFWNQSLLANNEKTGQGLQQLIKSFLGTLPTAGNNEAGAGKSFTNLPAASGSTGPKAEAAAVKQAAPNAGQPPAGVKQQLPAIQLSAAKTAAGPSVVQSTEIAQQEFAANVSPGKPASTAGQQTPGYRQPAAGSPAEEAILRQFVKELAQNTIMTRQSQLSGNDAAALKQLLSDGHITAKDWANLTRFLKAGVQAMPVTIRQAGEKVSELQQLWVMQQLSNLAELTSLPRKTMDSAGKLLEQLVQTLKSSFAPGSESIENHRSAAVTIPLYFGENQQHSYPAYIHIYHQSEDSGGAASGQERETWLRICLNTENAGVVDLVFRLYKDHQLNLRVGMGDHNAAQLFSGFIPEIKTAIETTPLILTEISVGAIGE